MNISYLLAESHTDAGLRFPLIAVIIKRLVSRSRNNTLWVYINRKSRTIASSYNPHRYTTKNGMLGWYVSAFQPQSRGFNIGQGGERFGGLYGLVMHAISGKGVKYPCPVCVTLSMLKKPQVGKIKPRTDDSGASHGRSCFTA